MTLKLRDMQRLFKKLKVERTSSNHHVRGFIVHQGKKLFPAILYSKGSGDIPIPVREKIRKSLYLNREEFDQILSCNLTREKYISIRMERGAM